MHSDHICCAEAAAAAAWAAAASFARSCAAFSRALHMFMFLAICGSLCSFFHFMRRFWNHILICRSVKFSACAISILLLLVRYLLKWNSFSNSRVWCLVYEVLDLFDSPSLLSEINEKKILIIFIIYWKYISRYILFMYLFICSSKFHLKSIYMYTYIKCDPNSVIFQEYIFNRRQNTKSEKQREID